MPPSDPISLAVEQSRAGSDLEHLIQNLVRIVLKADFSGLFSYHACQSLTILDEDVAASGTSRTTHPPPVCPLTEAL